MHQCSRTVATLIVLVGSLLLQTPLSAQSDQAVYTYGSDFDAQRYMSTPKGAPLSRGDYQNLPNAVSLRNLAPPAGQQGRAGSCVGWATAYSAATIANKITARQSSAPDRTTAPLSPAFVFNQIKLSDNCDGGSYTPVALELLMQAGATGINAFPYSDSRCYQQPTREHLLQARQYRIQDFIRLGSTISKRSLHIAVRKALAQNQPVVIGMTVGNTFQRHRGSHPVTFSRQDQEALRRHGVIGLASRYAEGWGGHAMTVVAYDDQRNGGAFLIMNSWGQKWGDQGFAWVKYSDFNHWIFEAYAVVPMEPKRPEPEVLKPDYGNKITMKDGQNNDLRMSKITPHGFRLDQALYSGSLLRAQIRVSESVYVYIVGTDSTSGSHTLLFPHEGVTNPYIASKNTMLLPGPTEDYYARLDDQAGTDYFIIVQSREKLDTRQLIQAFNRHARDSLEARFKRVFADRLVPPDRIKRSATGETVAHLGEQGVLVDVIEFEHLSGHILTQDRFPPKIVIVEPAIDQTDRLIDAQTPTLYVAGDEIILKGLAQDENSIKGVEVEDAFDLKFSSRGPFIARLDISQIPIGETRNIQISAVDANNNRSTRTWKVKRVQEQN